jgi:multisubunit Na+/H+ antiporter MnhE subunit
MLIATATAVAHWVLWLGYTNNSGYREMIVGALAAMVSTVAALVYAVQSGFSFRFRWRDIAQAIYLPWYALDGTWEVLHALAKQIFTRPGAPSLMAAVAFDVGGDDPHSAGRRALAVTYTTITPNFIVLGIVNRQQLMLYHQILPGKVLAMTCHLGARP